MSRIPIPFFFTPSSPAQSQVVPHPSSLYLSEAPWRSRSKVPRPPLRPVPSEKVVSFFFDSGHLSGQAFFISIQDNFPGFGLPWIVEGPSTPPPQYSARQNFRYEYCRNSYNGQNISFLRLVLPHLRAYEPNRNRPRSGLLFYFLVHGLLIFRLSTVISPHQTPHGFSIWCRPQYK